MKLEVPAYAQEVIQKKIDKLNRLAERNGFPPVQYRWGEKVKVGVIDPDGYIVQVEGIELFVDAPAWQVEGGWKLAAVLDHSTEPNLIRTVPGYDGDLSAFYDVEQRCDHCGQKRRRVKTIVVEAQDGRQMQVGTTCVQPYLGVDPEAILAATNAWHTIMEEARRWDSAGIRQHMLLEPRGVLTIAAMMIREYGWVSRSKAKENPLAYTPTADLVSGWIFALHRDEREEHPTDADRKLAEKVLEWMSGLETDNDYKYNLWALSQMESWLPHHIPLATSAVAAYLREQEEKARAEQAGSDWIGTPGQKLEVEATYQGGPVFETQWGTMYIHRFVDDDGNVIIWKTGKRLDLAEGDMAVITGKVKAHDTYRGIRQTVLTRCKVKAA